MLSDNKQSDTAKLFADFVAVALVKLFPALLTSHCSGMKKPLPLKLFDRDAAVARSISEGSARRQAEETAENLITSAKKRRKRRRGGKKLCWCL